LEASQDLLLVTPPSHFTPPKVKGLVGMFLLTRESLRLNDSKAANSVKGFLVCQEIYGDSLRFYGKNDEFRLECCILGEDPKNKEELLVFQAESRPPVKF
jgi:hypothetical protein